MKTHIGILHDCTLRDFLILGRQKIAGKRGQLGNNGCFRRPLNPSGIRKKLENPRKTASSDIRKSRRVQLHEKGHKEPWIIAMSDTPSKGKVLDYGMRWGIEPMFSDFKSRGFGITKTQLQHPDRIERLILVLTIALYWAASTGMAPPEKPPNHTQKKRSAA